VKSKINLFHRSIAPFILVLLAAPHAGLSQAPQAKPAFEVATVKPSPPLDMAKLAADMQGGKMPRFGPHVDAARASYTHMPLKLLIAVAYGVKAYQISGPGWLASEPFDIEAKMPDQASKDDAPRMLQTLLEERFNLAVHRDTQEHRVLALVVGKNGPKLKPSPTNLEAIDENAPLKPGEMKMEGQDGPIKVTRNSDGSVTMNMGTKGTIIQRMDMENKSLHLDANLITMTGLADALTAMLHGGGTDSRQVVDMTGLTGNYQVSLEIPLSDLLATARRQGLAAKGPEGVGDSSDAPALAASDPEGGSTLFRSVENLGLRLEPRKAKVEQLIIDHVEKNPTEN